MNNLRVKKGDTVLVIAGKNNGKQGKVLAVSPKTNRVIVEGVNIISKTKKARTAQEKSEIIKIEAPIDASNVMVICPVCQKATRIAHNEIDGKNVRICKKCGASLDAAPAKEKKAAKKAAKATTAKASKKTEKKVEEVATEAKKPAARKTKATQEKTNTTEAVKKTTRTKKTTSDKA